MCCDAWISTATHYSTVVPSSRPYWMSFGLLASNNFKAISCLMTVPLRQTVDHFENLYRYVGCLLSYQHRPFISNFPFEHYRINTSHNHDLPVHFFKNSQSLPPSIIIKILTCSSSPASSVHLSYRINIFLQHYAHNASQHALRKPFPLCLARGSAYYAWRCCPSNSTVHNTTSTTSSTS